MALFSQARFPIRSWRWLSLGAVIALPGIALAQTDYSAGKTPQQLFAGDCSACHQSPQGLARGRDASTLTGFLRDHYTTKVEWAGVLANYLVGVGGTRPRPPQQPAAGASTTRAPQPPASIPGGTEEAIAAPSNEAKPPAAAGARDRAKPGDARSAKGKLTPVESERDTAKANAESTGGQRTSPLPRYRGICDIGIRRACGGSVPPPGPACSARGQATTGAPPCNLAPPGKAENSSRSRGRKRPVVPAA